MKLKNVYVGFYQKDFQESLFYQINENTYYDLKKEENVSYLDLKLDSLLPYRNLFQSNKTRFKYLIDIYEKDRMERIVLNRVFLGSIFQIVDVTSQVTTKQLSKNELKYCRNKICQMELLKKNSLFYCLEEHEELEEATLKDLETGQLYPGNFPFQVGASCVPRRVEYVKPIQEVISLPKTLEKKELLLRYRKYYYHS